MKIFFIGVTQFSVACFEAILHDKYDIVGAAYTGDKIKVRRCPDGIRNANYADFRLICETKHIPAVYYNPLDKTSFTEEVRKLSPDIIVVAGWHYIIEDALLQIPAKGAIGLHSSMLPRYKGGAPLVWQIINGEEKAGISLFYLDSGVDSGDIIGQIEFSIDEDDTICTLIGKSEIAGVQLLKRYLPLLKEGKAPRIRQNSFDESRYPQRIPEDGKIDWQASPKQIRDFIRAQTKPYPGAYTIINNKKIVIWDADIFENDSKVE